MLTCIAKTFFLKNKTFKMINTPVHLLVGGPPKNHFWGRGWSEKFFQKKVGWTRSSQMTHAFFFRCLGYDPGLTVNYRQQLLIYQGCFNYTPLLYTYPCLERSKNFFFFIKCTHKRATLETSDFHINIWYDPTCGVPM